MTPFQTSPLVICVVLNWNRPVETAECLKSLQQVAYPHLELLVVDNHSTDNSVALLNQQFPHLQILQSQVNLGYAGGNNLGISYALNKNADYIWLLNNDTTVEPETLSPLVQEAQKNPQVAVFGSKILYGSDPTQIWFLSGSYDWIKHRHDFFARHWHDDPQVFGQQSLPSDWISGCSLFMRAAAIKQIGSLDEHFFMYYEDLDWCLTAKEKGWKCLVLPHSRIYHHTQDIPLQDSRAISLHYYAIRNQLYLLSKHGWLSFSVYVEREARELFNLLKKMRRSRRFMPWIKAHLLAHWHFLIKRGGPPPSL